MKRFLVVLFLFVSVSSFGLTQTEVEQAVYDALTSAPLNFSGSQINVVDWLYPSSSSPTLGEYLQYNIGGGFSYNPSDGNMAVNLVRARKALESLSFVTNDVGHIKTDLADLASEFSVWHTSWSTYSGAVDAHLQRITSMVGDLRSTAQAIGNYQSSLTNLVAGLKDDFSDMAHDLDTDLGQLVGDAQLTVNNLTQIAMDLSDSANYLSSIQQGVWDTAGAAGGILDYLEANLAQMFLSLDAGLLNVSVSITNALGDLPIPDLSNGIGVTNWPSSLTNTGWFDDMRSEAFKRNDILGHTYDAVTNIADYASNLVAQFVWTADMQTQFDAHTNTMESGIASNSVSMSLEADQIPTIMSNQVESIDADFLNSLRYDRFNDNPYDDAHEMEGDFSAAVSDALANGSLESPPEVIIFGSDDRPSGSRPDLRVRLPRIVFNVQTETNKWNSTSVLRSVMVSLWMFIAFVFKAIIIRDFLRWYSEREKRV